MHKFLTDFGFQLLHELNFQQSKGDLKYFKCVNGQWYYIDPEEFKFLYDIIMS